MTKFFAEEILKYMESQSPCPQIQVLVMGDNDLRWFHVQPEELYNIFRRFLLGASKVPNSRIILSTLVPSIENYR